MPALVVVGAQWGDEGKGKLVHLLARRARTVVRYQGGNNAGHTVVAGGREFALHLVPSGILVPGTRNVIGNGVVVNPAALRAELRMLEARGVRTKGRLFVSDRSHVIVAYHVLLDSLREARGRGIGTTRRGIGPCYEDKVGRSGIRVCDYLEPALFRSLVERNLARRKSELAAGSRSLAELRREVLCGYRELRAFLAPLVADAGRLVNDDLDAGRRVLFEGAQGVMLDLDFGTYPYVTSSNPNAGGACSGAGVGPTRIGEVMGATKAYSTRVGLGPFPTELDDEVADYIREKGREYGTTTGRARRVGWLDLVQLRHAVRVSGITRMAMMKLDTLSGISPLKVCTAYRLRGGRRTGDYPAGRDAQFEAEPVYRTFQGFSGDISGARRLSALPAGAREYVLWIEARLGVPISLVSVGRSEEQTIARPGCPWLGSKKPPPER